MSYISTKSSPLAFFVILAEAKISTIQSEDLLFIYSIILLLSMFGSVFGII